MPPGQVPAECFPGGASTRELTSSRWVSFACDVTVLGRTPAPGHPPDIVLGEPSDPAVTKDDDIAMEAVTTDTSADVDFFYCLGLVLLCILLRRWWVLLFSLVRVFLRFTFLRGVLSLDVS